MPHQLGNMELRTVSGGCLRTDGGNMFGVVPKVLWQEHAKPDERNRIALDTNCLLVRTAEHRVLIDTGCGSKLTAKKRDLFGLADGNPLLGNLAGEGVEPGDIDLVILTHLHFDHAGGCTLLGDRGDPEPAFPRAKYVVQKREWQDATGRLPELAGVYFEADFVPFERSGQLQLIDGEQQVAAGVTCRLSGGHTRGHQVVELGQKPEFAIYLGDACPTTAHLRTVWTTAYEQFPLDLRRTKPKLLGEAADQNLLVLFDHDPKIRAAYLERHEKKEFVVRERVEV